MIDLDGDCLSDLFLTVKDVSTGKYYYEIYLRREQIQFTDTNQDTQNAMNSFCLVAREEISPESIF